MKLRINQACDLNSISVLPPPSRRASAFGLGSDPSSLGKTQAAQLRSQSQQSFSQGMSLSQLSQSSLDENPVHDQRIASQEKDDSSRKISSLAPVTSTREESQMQLSRTSNNVLRRWNSASIADNKCLVSEELERRFRVVEGSLSRLGMILDSVQSDVMQASRAVKEVSLEMEGVRQKIILVENLMHQVMRTEEDIKAFLEGRFKSIPVQMDKESDLNKLNEVLSAIMALPEQIQGHLVNLQYEVCRVFTKETELIVNSMKSSSNKQPDVIQPTRSRSYLPPQQPQKYQMARVDIPSGLPRSHVGRAFDLKIEADYAKALIPKMTGSKPSLAPKQEEIPHRSQEQILRINIESDDDSGGDASCILLKKETGRESYLIDEAREESLRILRRARKRRRKQNNNKIFI